MSKFVATQPSAPNNVAQLRTYDDNHKPLVAWLTICASLIFAMIVLGGVTRLTHSGLSMVKWEPIMGVVPPFNQQAWLETFRLYQQFPEYQQVHTSMNLNEFKQIFYFEYSHRLLGRLIGLAFIVPIIAFWFKGWLKQQLLKKLIVVSILGGAQGLLGWYMVQSGLIDEPRVSQYRLTAHLGLAVALYGYIVWLAIGLVLKEKPVTLGLRSLPMGYPIALTVAIYLMILSGGMVASLRAGLVWNTFPLMGDSFFPPGLYGLTPVWLSAFEDMATVQFNHRVMAYSIFISATFFMIKVVKRKCDVWLRRSVISLYIALCCQVALGITTLLLVVPVSIAALHQACAIVVFTFAVITVRVDLADRSDEL